MEQQTVTNSAVIHGLCAMTLRGHFFKKISVIMTLSLGPLPPPLSVMAKVADSRAGGNGTAGTAMAYRFLREKKWRRLDTNLRMRYRMASPSGSL